MIEFILLGFLMYGKMTGYDLKMYMGQSTSNFYDASYGSIYPALKRLEKSGCVQVEDDSSGNRVRKVYTIQASGRKRFLDWMVSPLEISKTSTEPLIRVFFLGFIDPDKAIALIRGFQDRLKEELAHLEAIEPRVAATANQFQQSTLTYGKGHYRYQVEWCDQILGILAQSVERSI